MAAISTETAPQSMKEKNRGKSLTAKEVIGGIECQIVLELDSSGQYREVTLTPVGNPTATRSF
jgi:hypothetical protein